MPNRPPTALLLCILAIAFHARAHAQAASEVVAPSPVDADATGATGAAKVELTDSAPDATGWGVAAGLRYLEIVRGAAKPGEKLPLLIVIHGLGDTAHRGWVESIDVDSHVKARMILPQAPTPYGNGFAWFPYRAGSLDQAELARGISAAADQLARMLVVLQKQRPTRGKVVVTGFSQGGMLSYALALSHPELIAFALPISGMLPAQLWPSHPLEPAGFPRLLALHGTADQVVRFVIDEELVKQLNSVGLRVSLMPFAGAEHQITPEMSAVARKELSQAVAQEAETPTRAHARSK